MVISQDNGSVINFCGPFKGSVHDAKVWQQSGMGQWLLDHNFKVLGDKGYVGCLNVIHPHKKQNGSLSPTQQQFNIKLAQTRISIRSVLIII